MAGRTTTERIAGVARKLLDREGAEAVTMRRVAAAVGITPMALYRHFADREGLLNALADAGFEELAARVAKAHAARGSEERLKKNLDAFLDFGIEKPRLFELMFLKRRKGARQFPADFRARRSPTANYFAAALESGMEAGTFRRDDVWEITFEAGALLQALVMLYVYGRIGLSEREFRKLCHRAIGRYLRGIRL
jgi:AcrR family transcriptional regulator